MLDVQVIEGLQIIQKYKPEAHTPHHIGAITGFIIAGGTKDEGWNYSEEDEARLQKLGWKFDDEHGGWRAYANAGSQNIYPHKS